MLLAWRRTRRQDLFQIAILSETNDRSLLLGTLKLGQGLVASTELRERHSEEEMRRVGDVARSVDEHLLRRLRPVRSDRRRHRGDDITPLAAIVGDETLLECIFITRGKASGRE